MRVLLSIRREFAAKILDGTKKFEFRRTIFKKSEVRTVIVYASGAGGALVGEFEIGEVLHGDLTTLWDKTKGRSGISKEAFLDYFVNRNDGYAIGIEKVTRYETPLPLDVLNVRFPPQSFQYV